MVTLWNQRREENSEMKPVVNINIYLEDEGMYDVIDELKQSYKDGRMSKEVMLHNIKDVVVGRLRVSTDMRDQEEDIKVHGKRKRLIFR